MGKLWLHLFEGFWRNLGLPDSKFRPFSNKNYAKSVLKLKNSTRFEFQTGRGPKTFKQVPPMLVIGMVKCKGVVGLPFLLKGRELVPPPQIWP